MPQINESRAALEAAYRVYEAERVEILQQLAPLQARLREVQNTQSSLQRRINPDTPSHATTSRRPLSFKYAKLSVRWAILDLLNDSDGMTTSEISEALQAGGIQTRATNFANNVSSVLTTTMQKDHKEVEQLSDGSARWKLTPVGVSAITYLQGTDKFQRACGGRNGYVDKV
jgi:hypothetical protein